MRELLKLYNIHSPSGDCKDMFNYLTDWLTKNNIHFNTSHSGCIYHLTGEAGIILSAHMDQVGTKGQAVHFYMKDDCIRGYNDNYEQTNLGADDKNGIWIIQKVLLQHPDTQFIITTDEEIGCKGIHELQDNKVLDVIDENNNICLVLDRRGYGEILNKGGQGNYCSTLAQVLCNFFGKPFHTNTGSVSDTGVIRDYCESVNIGVGYYSAHTPNEYTHWTELNDILNKVLAVISKFTYYPTPVNIYDTRQQTLWRNF